MQRFKSGTNLALKLNIGLHNNPQAVLTTEQWAKYLREYFEQALAVRGGVELQSEHLIGCAYVPAAGEIEPTIVADIDLEVTENDLYLSSLRNAISALSQQLTQQAIAWTLTDQVGEGSWNGLDGPNATAWGAFNPDLFQEGPTRNDHWAFA